jgi:hypothetical protein
MGRARNRQRARRKNRGQAFANHFFFSAPLSVQCMASRIVDAVRPLEL